MTPSFVAFLVGDLGASALLAAVAIWAIYKTLNGKER